MIAAISFIRRKPDATIAEYRRHWHDVHGPLAAQLPGVRFYVQHHIAHDAPGTNDLGRQLRIDGIAQLWFDDEEARQACYDSEQEVVCDRDSLLWIGASARVVTEFRTLIPLAPEPSGIKQIALVLTDDAIPPRAAQAGLDAARLQGASGVQGLVAHSIIKQGATPNFARDRVAVALDAIYETSFADDESLKRNDPAFTSPGIATFAVRDFRIV